MTGDDTRRIFWRILALPICLVPAQSMAQAEPTEVVKSKAVQIEGSISDEDYPKEAIKNGETGTTAVRFVISNDGRVSTCEVDQSSGSDLLDAKSCEIIKERFRYKPARNVRGKAIPETRSQKLTWRLPSGRSLLESEFLTPYRDELSKASALMRQQTEASRIEALAIMNRLVEKAPRPSPAAGILDSLKGQILLIVRRMSAAKSSLLSSVEQYQDDADTIKSLLSLQIDTNDPLGALKTLKTAFSHQRAVVTNLDTRWMQILFSQIRALPAAERQNAMDDLCTILAGAGWHQKPRLGDGENMLGCAIKGHLRRAEIEEARALLDRQPEAATLATLSADNRFAAIWSELDRLGADGFRKSIESDVSRAADAVKARPNDFGLATRLVQALRIAGRSAEAAEAAGTLASKMDKVEAAGEPAFWLVNEYAYALDEAGQVDEAIARMDALVALGVNRYPDLISQAINRGEMLNRHGLHDRALKAFNEAEAEAEDASSAYGKMWIWAGRACALRQLNRAAEAKTDEKKIATGWKDNPEAATMAAACRSDQAAVEALLLNRLDDEESREIVLASLIRYSRGNDAPPYAAKLERVIDAARNSRNVQTKIAVYGRPVKFDGVRTYWGDF